MLVSGKFCIIPRKYIIAKPHQVELNFQELMLDQCLTNQPEKSVTRCRLLYSVIDLSLTNNFVSDSLREISDCMWYLSFKVIIMFAPKNIFKLFFYSYLKVDDGTWIICVICTIIEHLGS